MLLQATPTLHLRANLEAILSVAFNRAVQLVGSEEAEQMIELRPLGVLENHAPEDICAPLAIRRKENVVQIVSV